MRVRLIWKLEGLRNGRPWPLPGGIVDVPTSEAVNLISHGYAVPAPAPQEQERATTETIVERATLTAKAPKQKKEKR